MNVEVDSPPQNSVEPDTNSTSYEPPVQLANDNVDSDILQVDFDVPELFLKENTAYFVLEDLVVLREEPSFVLRSLGGHRNLYGSVVMIYDDVTVCGRYLSSRGVGGTDAFWNHPIYFRSGTAEFETPMEIEDICLSRPSNNFRQAKGRIQELLKKQCSAHEDVHLHVLIQPSEIDWNGDTPPIEQVRTLARQRQMEVSKLFESSILPEIVQINDSSLIMWNWQPNIEGDDVAVVGAWVSVMSELESYSFARKGPAASQSIRQMLGLVSDGTLDVGQEEPWDGSLNIHRFELYRHNGPASDAPGTEYSMTAVNESTEVGGELASWFSNYLESECSID